MRCRHIKNRLSAWTKAAERGLVKLKGRGGERYTDRGPLQCGIQTRLPQRQRCSTNLQFNSAPQNRSNDRRLEIARDSKRGERGRDGGGRRDAKGRQRSVIMCAHTQVSKWNPSNPSRGVSDRCNTKSHTMFETTSLLLLGASIEELLELIIERSRMV